MITDGPHVAVILVGWLIGSPSPGSTGGFLIGCVGCDSFPSDFHSFFSCDVHSFLCSHG